MEVDRSGEEKSIGGKCGGLGLHGFIPDPM